MLDTVRLGCPLMTALAPIFTGAYSSPANTSRDSTVTAMKSHHAVMPPSHELKMVVVVVAVVVVRLMPAPAPTACYATPPLLSAVNLQRPIQRQDNAGVFPCVSKAMRH